MVDACLLFLLAGRPLLDLPPAVEVAQCAPAQGRGENLILAQLVLILAHTFRENLILAKLVFMPSIPRGLATQALVT